MLVREIATRASAQDAFIAGSGGPTRLIADVEYCRAVQNLLAACKTATDENGLVCFTSPNSAEADHLVRAAISSLLGGPIVRRSEATSPGDQT